MKQPASVSSLRISRSTNVHRQGWRPRAGCRRARSRHAGRVDLDRLGKRRRRARCLQRQVDATAGEPPDLARDVVVGGVERDGARRAPGPPRDSRRRRPWPRSGRAPRIRSHWTSMSPIDPAPSTTAVSAGTEVAEVQHVARDGRRLDERGRLERQVVRDGQHVARGERDELGEGTVAARADERVGRARREASGPTLVAGVAGHQRDERRVAPEEAPSTSGPTAGPMPAASWPRIIGYVRCPRR